jgi:hypothetical protein
VIDKPELPAAGITNENDVHTETLSGNMQLKRGTSGVFNRWEGVSTYLKVESDEPKDKLAHLLKNAKAGCFAEGLITQQVPLHSDIEVNGVPFQIEDGSST